MVEYLFKALLIDFFCIVGIGVARGGAQVARPPPIKIPPMIKNYDNIA